MRANEFAVRLGRATEAVRLATRSFLPIDTNRVPAEWTHVTKVDPEEAKRLPLVYPLYLQHTSAVSVGGSADVTGENTEETFRLLEYAPVPSIHEPSGPRHVTDATRAACHFLAVPEVLNGDSESLIGTLGAGAEYLRDELVPAELDEKLPWLPGFVRDRVADFATSWLLADAVFEAYIIQNPDSAAAREANVGPDDAVSAAEAGRRALAAEKHLESDLVYLEYSGTFGGEDAEAELAAIAANTGWSRVWYGGGLDSGERAQRMLDAGADAVVVGDVFHEVAAEETRLRADASADLSPDASYGTVREWVDERFDAAGSAAARYLSTCRVPNPEVRAREYLAIAVRVGLELEAVNGTDDPERTVADLDALPGERALARVLPAEEADRLARELALAYLGAPSDPAFDHLGLR